MDRPNRQTQQRARSAGWRLKLFAILTGERALAALFLGFALSALATLLVAAAAPAAGTGSPATGPGMLLVPGMRGQRWVATLLAAAVALGALRALNQVIPGWGRPTAAAQPLGIWRCGAPDTLALLAARLRPLGAFEVIDGPVRAGRPFHAQIGRRGARKWLAGAYLLGVLLLALAALVTMQSGWQSAVTELVVGESQPLPELDGRSVRLEQLAILPAADGYYHLRAGLSLEQQDGQPISRDVAYGRAATFADARLYLVGHGPAVRVIVRDAASGERLALGPVGGGQYAPNADRFAFSHTEQERLLAIPARRVLLRLTDYPDVPSLGLAQRALQVQVIDGDSGKLIAEELLTASGQVTAPDLSLELGLEYAVWVQARHDPGLPWRMLAIALLLVGLPGVAWPQGATLWLSADAHDGGGWDCWLYGSQPAADLADWASEVRRQVAEVCGG
jgi:hypothetical protein